WGLGTGEPDAELRAGTGEDLQGARELFRRVRRRAACTQDTLVALTARRHDEIDVEALGEQRLPQRDRPILFARQNGHDRRFGRSDDIPNLLKRATEPADIRPQLVAQLGVLADDADG